MVQLTQRPYLNLGCGHIILPGVQPGHHALVDGGIYAYPLWLNVDRNNAPGVDKVMDLFRYPWDLPDDSFDGALLTHIVEHIPHDIRPSSFEPEGDNLAPVIKKMQRYKQLERCQDGWYAFFAELYRVLTPGAVVHVLSPYAWSQGAVTDPTHTRLITEHTFTHSMSPDPHSPFHYETGGIHFEMVEPARFTLTAMFEHLRPQADDTPAARAYKEHELMLALQTRVNVAYELYVKLRAVK